MPAAIAPSRYFEYILAPAALGRGAVNTPLTVSASSTVPMQIDHYTGFVLAGPITVITDYIATPEVAAAGAESLV